MVTYDKNEKDLVIPSALGLAGMQDSVCGVTEQEVIEIVESAITDYDTEIQVDFEDIRENVSGNTDDIAALSAATEALEQRVDDISTSALTEQIEALSGSVGDIRSDVETLSGDTDSIRSDVAALSAVTSGIAVDVETAFKSEIGLRFDLTSLSGRTSAITEQVTELSATTSGISADVAALSGVTEGIATSVGGLSTGLDTLSGVTSGLSANVAALSAVTSGIAVDVAALEANDNIVFFNLLTDYGTSSDEIARLYDKMAAAEEAGKTVVVISNFATGDTGYASIFATFGRNAGNSNFYGRGYGGYWDSSKYIAARVTPVIGRTDTFNLIAKNGHFYYSPNGKIEPYTLPTSSNSTKGGIKVGSGVTMSGDFLSVKYGDGLGMSGDTLVVSGGTGGGTPQPVVINDILSGTQAEIQAFYDEMKPLISGSTSEGWGFNLFWRLEYYDNQYNLAPFSTAWINKEDAFGNEDITFVFEYTGYATDFNNAATPDRTTVTISSDGTYHLDIYGGRGIPSSIPQPAWVRFGNDERGRLTYDADNDVFLYDNATIPTGDTTTVYADLIDYLFTNNLFDGGLIDGYIYALNLNDLTVTKNGVSKVYAHPILSRVEMSSPVTIDGQDFYKEITYNYGDYILTALYGDGNKGANLRITTL